MKTNDLKAEFIRNGYTQQQIADMLGITTRALQYKLSGKNKNGSFTDKEIGKLCEVLKIPAKKFFEDDQGGKNVKAGDE